MSNKSDQYVIYLKQCFLSLYYKKITVCLKVSVKFHVTYLIPNQFHPTPPAKHHRHVWQSNVYGQKKIRDQPSAQCQEPLSQLVASFSLIPICPGTHTAGSFLSALILCESSCICISRGWSVLKFLSACRAESESDKIVNFLSFD